MCLARCLAALPIVLLLTALAVPPTHASTFTAGDMYLLSETLPEIGTGILRIDPATGAVSLLAEVSLYAGNFSYDPYRDRLLGSLGAGTGGLMTVDATGTVTQLSPTLPTPFLVEPRGDGILYAYYSLTGNFGYVDASNNLHDLLDESGTGPYSLGNDAAPTDLHFDLATNSLIGFAGTLSDIPACPDQTRSCAFRIPLTAAGTQVAGPITATQVDISSTPELVVGASQGPGNGVLWVADTNSNNREPRMQLLDPPSMVSTPYASNGPYTGAASTNAGSYSSRRGEAVVLDTYRDSLRAFSYGEVGPGTLFASGVSHPGGWGETARLIEIRSSPLLTDVTPPVPAPEGLAPSPALGPASPNPFRATTELRLRLTAPARVTLSIHDATGRRVRSLADGPLGAGTHVFRWNGDDARGRAVAPGIYFARLTRGDAAEMKKLVLER